MSYLPLEEMLAKARQQEREQQLARAILLKEFAQAQPHPHPLRWIVGHALEHVGNWIVGPHTHEPLPSSPPTILEPARSAGIR